MVENSNAPNPMGPVLFFDGECALCHGAVRRLIQWERPQHEGLLFAPLDGPTAKKLRRQNQLTSQQDAVVLWTAKRSLLGEAAVGEALNIIGRTGWSRTFQRCPAPIRRMGYRMMARHRHRLFGRVESACPLPSEPARFLP